jgi:heptosyltransferase-2
LRDAINFRLAGIKPLYGAAARGRGFLLQRSFKFPRRKDHVLNELHHANKYLSMVKALGAPDWSGELPEFNITPEFEMLRPELQTLCQHPRLLTLAAGAAYGSSKRWDSASFKTVAEWWIGQGGIVAVLGGAKERNICQDAVAGLSPDNAFNLAGNTDMPELMHLLKHAAVCVANDSGIMHLAAALGCPGVAIFGPTDHSATSPISASWKIVYLKQPCAPCFKRECLKGNPVCMNVITPQMVIDELIGMSFFS